MKFVIKLNNSEQAVFAGCFGFIFSLPNFNQIFLEKIFPIIIETSTSFTTFFKVLYVLLSLLLAYNTYGWIIQLIGFMNKTKNIHKNYGLYVAKIFFFGVLGFAVAIGLNNWLF